VGAAGDSRRCVAAIETRSDPRVGVEVRGELASDQFAGPLAVVTRDLSFGGACVATRSPIAVSSLRQLVLHLPERSVRFSVAGRWQHWNPATGAILTGLAFTNLTPELEDVLWDCVLEATKDVARFLLRRSDLRDVGIDGAMSLAQASRLCVLGVGSAVFQQGGGAASSQNSFFVLREGSVVLRTRLRGAIERDVAMVQPGQLIGGLPMLADVGHTESAIARSPAKLLEIDERAYRYLMQARPWVAQKVAFAAARAYAQRMHATLESLATPDRALA
jgi:hypothetical protein